MTPCPRCDAPEDQVEVRDASKVARCRACGLVFDPRRAAERRLLSAASLVASPTAPRGEKLVAPDGFEALETRSGTTASYRDAGSTGTAELVITRKWVDTSAFLSSRARFFWLALVGWGLAMMFFKDRGGGGPHPGIGALMIGLALLIFGIIQVARVNQTQLVVRDGRLRVTHGPVPWPGGRDLLARSIEQLYCDLHEAGRNNPETYRVWAVLRGGKRVLLIGDLLLGTHALFLEQAVERTLGIVDRPVAGELPK